MRTVPTHAIVSPWPARDIEPVSIRYSIRNLLALGSWPAGAGASQFLLEIYLKIYWFWAPGRPEPDPPKKPPKKEENGGWKSSYGLYINPIQEVVFVCSGYTPPQQVTPQRRKLRKDKTTPKKLTPNNSEILKARRPGNVFTRIVCACKINMPFLHTSPALCKQKRGRPIENTCLFIETRVWFSKTHCAIY